MPKVYPWNQIGIDEMNRDYNWAVEFYKNACENSPNPKIWKEDWGTSTEGELKCVNILRLTKFRMGVKLIHDGVFE